jgi:hypothetical protein
LVERPQNPAGEGVHIKDVILSNSLDDPDFVTEPISIVRGQNPQLRFPFLLPPVQDFLGDMNQGGNVIYRFHRRSDILEDISG